MRTTAVAFFMLFLQEAAAVTHSHHTLTAMKGSQTLAEYEDSLLRDDLSGGNDLSLVNSIIEETGGQVSAQIWPPPEDAEKGEIIITGIESTATPSVTPSLSPSVTPSTTPSSTPSTTPSSTPSTTPSTTPSSTPSTTPSKTPSVATPTTTPSVSPTVYTEDFTDSTNIEDQSFFDVKLEEGTTSVFLLGAAASIFSIGYFFAKGYRNARVQDMPDDITITSGDGVRNLGINSRTTVRRELFTEYDDYSSYEV